MTDLALHLDATRARAACISPSGSYLPVLDTHGRSAMPLVVAVGLRGELLTGRSAWDVLLEKPESACGAFLPHVGTGRLFRFGNREADPAQLLAHRSGFIPQVAGARGIGSPDHPGLSG